MAENTVLRFHLDGADYTLCGDMSQERMREIVRLVEEKIDNIRAMAPAYTSVRASTLAALQLAEALLDACDENAALMAEANIGGQCSLRLPYK